MRHENGFSLIEALVALVILAFAGIALLGATETHSRRIAALENRAIAQWVAENRMVELALAKGAPTAEVVQVPMLGINWTVRQSIDGTDDPDLTSVELQVSAPDSDAILSRFTGFVDTGASQ